MSLHVRNVRVEYPGAQRAAVDGVTLDVATGEVLAVVGPSGCGKSSLLRAIAGVEPLAGGDVLWDDESVARVPVHRRRFGLMFQDGQLFAHQDVGTNVAYGLAAAHVPREERERRAAELLELVGLGGWERRAVATLSGGERQRVALARALAPRPRLLLLDEPLSALDRELRERLARDLRDVLTVTATTGVFVTHDQDEACQVADRIAVMADGRVLQVAEPAQLWETPASEQVATFWGMETIVDAEHPLHGALLAAVRGTGRSVDPHARLAMASGAAVASAELAAPIDGVPPEDGVGTMHPHAIPQQRGGEPAATGVVRRVVQQRGGVLLDVEVLAAGQPSPEPGGAAPAVVVASAIGNGLWQVGQRVSLVIDPRRVAVLPD